MAIGDQGQQAQALGLDLSQISDAVSRQKISDRRLRNEMMRQGTSDPNAFSMQNKQQLQQAQQPSEFWGAGRKELTQGTDTSLLKALGGSTANLGGQDYYYSNYDLNKASWGSQDADDVDLGSGKYNIMQNGQSLGTGYKSLSDTIRELNANNFAPKETQKYLQAQLPQEAYTQDVRDILGANLSVNSNWLAENNYRQAPTSNNLIGMDPTTFEGYTPTYEKLTHGFTTDGSNFFQNLAEAQSTQNSQATSNITGNTVRDWETLGQLLNYGKVTGDFNTPHAIGGNQVSDPISGLNTLYGSKPIIYNGKLLGYNQQGDVTPITNQWNDQWDNISRSGGPFGLKVKTEHNWDQGGLNMGRSYNDQDWWNKNVQKNGDGTFTIKPELAEQNPGWLNKDQFVRNAGSSTSSRTLGNVRAAMSGIGSIVDMFVPWTFGTAKYVGANTADMIGGMSFGDTAENSIKNQMPTWLVTQGLSDLFSGAGEAMGASGNWATAIDNGLSGAAGGAITAGMQGNNIGEGALYGGVGSALGGYLGGLAGDATSQYGDIISKMSRGAAQGGIKSLFNKNSPIEGSLYGAMSGGLHGFLNSSARDSNTLNKETNASNKNTAREMTSLAKLFMKNRNK